MPIYEFYCPACHVILSFLARMVTDKRPSCPHCGRPELGRCPSVFGVPRDRSGRPGGGVSGHLAGHAGDGVDEARMDRAMDMLLREGGSLPEGDHRAAALFMRRLSDAAGLRVGPGMEEALRRLEAGEESDGGEADLEDMLEDEDPLVPAGARRGSGAASPGRDMILYDL